MNWSPFLLVIGIGMLFWSLGQAGQVPNNHPRFASVLGALSILILAIAVGMGTA